MGRLSKKTVSIAKQNEMAKGVRDYINHRLAALGRGRRRRGMPRFSAHLPLETDLLPHAIGGLGLLPASKSYVLSRRIALLSSGPNMRREAQQMLEWVKIHAVAKKNQSDQAEDLPLTARMNLAQMQQKSKAYKAKDAIT